MHHTLKFTAALTLAVVCLSATSLTHAADYRMTSKGCRAGDTPYNSNGNAWCKQARTRSADGPVYVAPSHGTVAKANPFAFCPSGYFTEGDSCTTPMRNAPQSRTKAGACPAGTVDEYGAYCTDKITDLSDPYLDELNGISTRDFNVVYTTALNNGKTAPKDQRPAAFQAAVNERQAQGKPWVTYSERGREARETESRAAKEKNDAEQAKLEQSRSDALKSACDQNRAVGYNHPNCPPAGAAVVPTAAAAAAPNDAGAAGAQGNVQNDAAKALGGALKGVFGR